MMKNKPKLSSIALYRSYLDSHDVAFFGYQDDMRSKHYRITKSSLSRSQTLLQGLSCAGKLKIRPFSGKHLGYDCRILNNG